MTASQRESRTEALPTSVAAESTSSHERLQVIARRLSHEPLPGTAEERLALLRETSQIVTPDDVRSMKKPVD